MNRERLEQIGKFLEGRMVVHRNVEHDSPWTTEEKMIQELYDIYLDLLIEYGKQKEVIDKIYELIKQHIRKDEFLELNEWQTRDLLDLLKEVSK